MEQVLYLITEKLKIIVDVPEMDAALLGSKRKAIAALFPYAAYLEKSGQGDMVDAILRVARASESVFSWHHVLTHITAWFDESSPPPLNRAITSISPIPLASPRVEHRKCGRQVGSGNLDSLLFRGRLARVWSRRLIPYWNIFRSTSKDC